MDAWEKLGYACLVTCAIGITFLFYFLIFSDGRIDYCKIQTSKDWGGKYQLVGHRPWRTEEILASGLDSFEDAVGKAEQISCEIR